LQVPEGGVPFRVKVRVRGRGASRGMVGIELDQCLLQQACSQKNLPEGSVQQNLPENRQYMISYCRWVEFRVRVRDRDMDRVRVRVRVRSSVHDFSLQMG
jgi:hypothetical protein